MGKGDIWIFGYWYNLGDIFPKNAGEGILRKNSFAHH